jgi:DNA-binding CsgD family transcriptional regulator
MNPLSPKQILRNLENGFFMTHQEQTEAANLIRQLQESNKALMEGMLLNAETIVKLRRMIHLEIGLDRATQLLGNNNEIT